MITAERLAFTPVPENPQDIENRLAWTTRGYRDYTNAHEVHDMMRQPFDRLRNGFELIEIARNNDFPIDEQALGIEKAFWDASKLSYSSGTLAEYPMRISALEGKFSKAVEQFEDCGVNGSHQIGNVMDSGIFLVGEMLRNGKDPAPALAEFRRRFRRHNPSYMLEKLLNVAGKYGIESKEIMSQYPPEVTFLKDHKFETADFAILYLDAGMQKEAAQAMDLMLDDKEPKGWVNRWSFTGTKPIIEKLYQKGMLDYITEFINLRPDDLGITVPFYKEIAKSGSEVKVDDAFFLDAIAKCANEKYRENQIFGDALLGLSYNGYDKNLLNTLVDDFLKHNYNSDAGSLTSLATKLVSLGYSEQASKLMEDAYQDVVEDYHPYPHVESFMKPPHFGLVGRTAVKLDFSEIADRSSNALLSLAVNKDTDKIDEMDFDDKRPSPDKGYRLQDLMMDDVIREGISQAFLEIGIEELKKGITYDEFQTLKLEEIGKVRKSGNKVANAGIDLFIGK